MRILGLVAATHDSGIAILDDGVPQLVLEEERLSRVKRTKAFPGRAINAALRDGVLDFDSIDVITTPWDVAKLRVSFAKALLGRFPASLALLLPSSHEPQDYKIADLNRYLSRRLKRRLRLAAHPPIVNVGHHDSHAAFFFVSPFDEAAVVVMDGYGDDASTSIYHGRDGHVSRLWNTSFFNSMGMVYTFLTEYLGFGGFSEEGKVMALAAYGSPTYRDRFRDCVRLLPEGRYQLDMSYFSFNTYGQLRPFKRKFIEAFGPPRRKGEPLTDRHRDLAFALQSITEEVVLHIVRDTVKRTGSRNLVMSGGVALNCVANARILEKTDVARIWVPPCASDTGAPLGSALWHHHQTLRQPRRMEMTHPYYGLAYDRAAVDAALTEAGLVGESLSEPELLERVAADLAAGRIVGWFQGRFELGPRALGNRSILADPRRHDIRDVINTKIKHREPFRPFAPAVLEERASEYFDIAQPDPFMTLAPRIRPHARTLIPAAVHIDGTGRIQTVSRATNPRFWGLIDAFARLTGVPILLNTSFNRQEPIVATPAEAISCFMRTGMDVLVLGDIYIGSRVHGETRDRRHAKSQGPV